MIHYLQKSYIVIEINITYFKIAFIFLNVQMILVKT